MSKNEDILDPLVCSDDDPSVMVTALANELLDAPIDDVPAKQQFSDFISDTALQQALVTMGFQYPTPVQSAVLHDALNQKDLLVQSKTGSGKTCAFGLPLIANIVPNSAAPHQPLGLVLLPTRELAYQVAEQLKRLAMYKGTRIATIYGGVPLGGQSALLRQGVDIIVGTPGRLLDHIRRGQLNLEALKIVVLDEADEMLSMGFWGDITEILRLAPKKLQTMLFSATLPYEVVKSAMTLLHEPVRIDLSADKLTVAGIRNCIMHVMPEISKPRQLLYILESIASQSAIIFCNTRNEAEMLAKFLVQQGFGAEPLTGSLKQKDRERVMHRIKSHELRFMVATDIAARGIDIKDLTHVFNYSLPEFSEVYLHRVGRTGRQGKSGYALSLVDGKGLGTLTQLEREFGITFEEIPLPREEEVMQARSVRIMKELADKAQVSEVGQHLPVAQDIIQGEHAQQIVAFLLKSYFSAEAEGQRALPHAEADNTAEAADEHYYTSSPPRRPSSNKKGEHSHDSNDNRGRRRNNGRTTAATRSTSPPRESPRGTNNKRTHTLRHQHQHQPRFEIVDAADILADRLPAPSVSVAPARQLTADATTVSKAGSNDVVDRGSSFRVNIGFDDGFKGRGQVAKKIAALAGLNEGIIQELESRRDHAVLSATPDIAEMVLDRVDGACLGKKVISVKML